MVLVSAALMAARSWAESLAGEVQDSSRRTTESHQKERRHAGNAPWTIPGASPSAHGRIG